MHTIESAGLISETGIAINLVIYSSVFSFHVSCSLLSCFVFH